MSRGLARAERLHEMERLYLLRAHSDGEMAERLGVDRSTVFRDRRSLETTLPFIQEGPGKWRIDRVRYLSNIRVNLNEAMALYLAARRASQQTRLLQPHTATALEKLAVTLRKPMTEHLVRSAQAILRQRAQQEQVKVLETLARGWVDSMSVRIRYHSLRTSRSLDMKISPYLIEPSPWSDSVYVIGHSDLFADIATLKIDRIESAYLTGKRFEIPDDFDEQTLLRYAWGIWGREGEPERVVLRFSRERAVRRLKESVWHPLETITDLEDGGCLWQAPIAEWQEMLPWIRGWGADVEVLEPRDLREMMMGETKAMAEQYGWQLRSTKTGGELTLEDTYRDFFGDGE